MIRLGVIGLGTIFHTQFEALDRKRESCRLLAVCDSDPRKREVFRAELLPRLEDKPDIYQDSDDLFRDPRLDAVLIATPPATHFALAQKGLVHRKHILLEKPAATSLAELETLYKDAERHGVILHIAYHAAFGREVEWFLAHEDALRAQYRLGPLSRLECEFYDPYMEHGAVMEQKRPLGGSFMDSGVNALSVCARLTALSDFKQTDRSELTDGITVYYAQRGYRDAERGILIRTGWNMGLDQKTTLLEFAGSDGKLLLHHSEQKVIRLQGEKKEVLYRNDSTPRLVAHYDGVFADFCRAYSTGRPNREQSLQIHRLLLGE